VLKIVRPIANRPQDAIPDAILPHTTSKRRARSSRRAKKQRISNTGVACVWHRTIHGLRDAMPRIRSNGFMVKPWTTIEKITTPNVKLNNCSR
jgi:hypothetical protein